MEQTQQLAEEQVLREIAERTAEIIAQMVVTAEEWERPEAAEDP